MATFQYIAKDSSGQEKRGMVEAGDRSGAIAAIRAQGIEPIVKDTICTATRKRQDETAQLAETVDAMVVLGGRNSSNTTRLAEICADACERTHHVESVNEINPTWFASCESVGVTAGASTPENQIKAVVDFLKKL